MNSQPLQPSSLLSRSLTEGIVSGVGKALDMNAHMLRDIGAHDRLIAHAAAQSDAEHRQRIAFQLSTPLLVVALIATAALGTVAEAADSLPPSRAPATAQLIGSFTGEYVNGAPVYRLPSVIVVGSRKVERVKLEREEQSTRAQQARAKAAAKKAA